MQGTQVHHCYVWPMCSEGRGVEAELQYHYEDHKMPEKGFRLALMLRLSESTDVVGIAVKCLLSLASHFKIVTESAMGELSLLPNLLDISNSYAPSLIGIQPQYIRYSDIFVQIQYVAKQKGRDSVLARQTYHTYCQSQSCMPISDAIFQQKSIA